MNIKKPVEVKYPTITYYLLGALVPYTEPNLKLSFQPSAFFDDLEKISRLKASRASLRTAYHRAIKKGLIELDGHGLPRLSAKGQRKIKPFHAKKLKGAKLMVVFDIPEIDRLKRNRLRLLLRELSFQQVQKSVWMSENDHREYLKAEIKEYKLEKYVEVLEARSIKL